MNKTNHTTTTTMNENTDQPPKAGSLASIQGLWADTGVSAEELLAMLDDDKPKKTRCWCWAYMLGLTALFAAFYFITKK